jgi:hypothetical protein
MISTHNAHTMVTTPSLSIEDAVVVADMSSVEAETGAEAPVVDTKICGQQVLLKEEQQQHINRNTELDKFLSQFKDIAPINKKKRRKILDYTKSRYESYKFTVVISDCCKHMDLDRAYTAYKEAIQNKVVIPYEIYSSLISLVAGLGEQGSSSGPIRTQQPPSDVIAARHIFTNMREKHIPLSESVYTAMIRTYSLAGLVKGISEEEMTNPAAAGAKVTSVELEAAGTSSVILLSEALELYKEMTRPFTSAERKALVLEPGMQGGQTMSPANDGIATEVVSTDVAATSSSSNLPERYERPFTPKLRTFSPLLQGFSHDGDIDKCIWLYEQMTDVYRIVPLEKDYLSLFKVCTKVRNQIIAGYGIIGDNDVASQPLYVHANATFYKLLDNFMEDFLVPKRALGSWDVLTEWFAGDIVSYTAPETVGIKPDHQSAWDICVTRASKEGHLSVSGYDFYLQSIDLAEDTREALLQQIDAMASQRHDTIVHASAQTTSAGLSGSVPSGKIASSVDETSAAATMKPINTGIVPQSDVVLGGGKGRMTPKMLERLQANAVYTSERWHEFLTFVSELESTRVDTHADALQGHITDKRRQKKHLAQRPRYQYRYDVVIDGANCGYYKQNYPGAPSHVDYHQIEWMMSYLKDAGYKPLLMLHCRHFIKIPNHCMHIVQKWKDNKELYITPARCNDDWFWLYLAMKLRLSVVTNDEMRDHHFQLLSTRCFGRWKERKQIHFTFSKWTSSSSATTASKLAQRQKGDVSDAEDASDTGSESEDGQEDPMIAPPSKTTNVQYHKLPARNMINGSHQRQVRLSIPRCYSQRMQRLPPPVAMSADVEATHIDNGNAIRQHGAAYAFPCEENRREWLCCFQRISAAQAAQHAGVDKSIGVKRGRDDGDP